MTSYKMYPTHPDWKNSEMPLFEDCYDEIVSVFYSLRDPKPKLVSIRLTKTQQCALCLTADSKKFSQVAHLLPASLGNRHYITEEECDKCNNDYGKEYENALASMLSVERAFYRVRGRKGTAKLQPKGSASDNNYSYIGGGSYDEGLRIYINEEDNSVTSQEKEGNIIVFSARNPSYDPTKALKSILKSFWLSINDTTRKEVEYVREYLFDDGTGPKLKFQSEFFKYFLPDALDSVMFEAWRKKSDCRLQTSEFVVRLSLVHTSILWCSPDSSALVHGPSLLPPFIQDKLVTKFEAVKVICPTEKATVKAHDIHFSVVYKSRIRRNNNEVEDQKTWADDTTQPDDGSSERREEKQSLTAISVWLEASVDDVCLRIEDAKLITYRLDSQFVIFRLMGGSFAADLFMQIDRNTQNISYREDYKFHLHSAKISSDTIKFLTLAYQPRSQLKAYTKDSNQQLFIIPFFRGEQSPPSLSVYGEMLECLKLINLAIEADFRVSRALSPKDLHIARRLTLIIKKGYEERSPQGISLEMEKEQCENLIVYLKQNPGAKITIRQPDCLIDFLNEQLDIGPIKIVIETPTIDDKSPSENDTLNDGIRTIWLNSSRTIVFYEKWQITEAVTSN